MKINEVMQEADVLSRLSQGIKGAVSNVQKSRGERQSIASGGENLQYELKNWEKYIKQQQSIYPQEIKDADFFKQLLLNWVIKKYPRADKPLFSRIYDLNVASQQAVQSYIANLFNSEMSNFAVPKSNSPVTGVVQPTKPAPASDVLSNFRIVQANPLIYQYGNNPKKQYHLNDRGQWALFPGQKEIDQTTSALLSRAADRDGM